MDPTEPTPEAWGLSYRQEVPPMRPSADPQGNPRSSQSPAPPPPENILPAAPLPPVPEHLGTEGRRIWAEVWEAGGSAYNPATDGHVIERYASLQERRLHFLRVLEAEGYTSVGSQGQLVAHPAARLLLDVEGKLTPLEDRLGLSPEARFRLGIAAVESKSKLDAFLEEDQ